MTTTPPDAPSGSTEPPVPPGPPSSWVEPESPPPSGPRVTREEAKDLGRIRRSLTDRKIAGVAGGIARHFDIDPLLVRVGLVLGVFFGGGGILIYAAGWLLIPEDGSDTGTIRADDRTRTLLLTVVGAIAALSLVGDSFGGWSFPWPLAIIGLVIAAIAAAIRPKPHPGPLPAEGWISAGMRGEVPGSQTASRSTYPGYEPGPRRSPVDTRRKGPLLFWFTIGLALVGIVLVATFDLAGWDAPISAYPAAVLASCGVMLLVGAFYGRAGGLTFIGLLAALVTLAGTAVQDLSAGQVTATPTTAAAVESKYEIGAGEIILDLTELSTVELEKLNGKAIKAEARFGHILVLVPARGLDVEVDSHIEGAGESVLFGEQREDSLELDHEGGAAVPEIELDLEVFLGQIEVKTEEAA